MDKNERFIVIDKNVYSCIPSSVLSRFMSVLSEMERFLPKIDYEVIPKKPKPTNTETSPPTIRCVRMSSNAILPERQTTGSAGYDLHALFGGQILPGEKAVIRTGLAVEIPDGYVGIILPRSGLSALGIVAIPSVIDSDYRGEIRIILHNINQGLPGMDNNVFAWKGRDRLGQLLVLPCLMGGIQEVSALMPTDRGLNGFGSTGINYNNKEDERK